MNAFSDGYFVLQLRFYGNPIFLKNIPAYS